MTNTILPANIKRSNLKFEEIYSLITLAILIAQVILLVTLTQRVIALEQVFTQASGGAPSEEVVLDRVPDERGHVFGPADAPITIVEFSDFQCPFCASAVEPIKQILAKYPNQIRFVYRHYPLTSIHADAFRAAEAAECASEQGKFWEMHDLLFKRQSALGLTNLHGYAEEIGVNVDQFKECLSSGRMAEVVNQDLAAGQTYGVNGTPTLFVNREMIVGVSELEAAVKQALTTP